MSQIIHFQIGQCGNQIGQKFWQLVAQEHSLDPDGKAKQGGPTGNISTYFCQTKGGIHVPRAILADLQPGPIDAIRASQYGRIFRPENDVFGFSTAGGNYAKGFYQQGSQVIENILQATRREAEQCECIQAMQLIHSMGGGTGSGLTCLVIQKLRDQFPDRLISTSSILPSPNVSDSILQPYNSIFTLMHFYDQTDLSVIFDNQALLKLTTEAYKTHKPTYNDFNNLISKALSSITSSLRFPGPKNTSLRKILVNMSPFKRLHFFTAVLAPIRGKENYNLRSCEVEELSRQVLDPKNSMCSFDRRSGKYISASVVFRGKDVSTKKVQQCMFNTQNKSCSPYVQWISNCIQTSICSTPLTAYPTSAVMLWNTTAIAGAFRKITDRFDLMFRRKAFVHYYEGVEEMEFVEAVGKVKDLMREYMQCEDAVGMEEGVGIIQD